LNFSQSINLYQFYELIQNPKLLKIDNASSARIEKSYNFLLSKKGKGNIYGLNSGFGALGYKQIKNSDTPLLQKKLIYHLATGTGPIFDTEESSAIHLARLWNLSKGFSAISPASFHSLHNFFTKQITPHIPSIGTVGASGDLTPLAHLTLSFLGESVLYYKNKPYTQLNLFNKLKIKPLHLESRDGLAIVNGTSTSTAIAILGVLLMEKALRISIFHSFLMAEVFEVSEEYYSSFFYEVKPHLGMKNISDILLELFTHSSRIPKTLLYNDKQIPTQPPYTLRAITQVLGSIYDSFLLIWDTINKELHSVSDNPLFFPDKDLVVHGANFYGSHTAIASDQLKLLSIHLAILSERRIARLTDEKLNASLPPFLVQSNLGINSGFMGAQVTASALLAEMRSLGTPASIQSIPTNANNQDIVPMASTAARMAKICLERCLEILSIEGLILSQAMEIIGTQKFSTRSKNYLSRIRKVSPSLLEDRPLHSDIENLKQLYKENEECIPLGRLF
jgi:tyrosine ammonia-lyase